MPTETDGRRTGAARHRRSDALAQGLLGTTVIPDGGHHEAPLQDRFFSARHLILVWTVMSCGRIGYDLAEPDGSEGTAAGGAPMVTTTGSPTMVGTTSSGGTSGG